MKQNNLYILVLLQLLFLSNYQCHQGSRLACKSEDNESEPVKFMLYLVDNGEVFYKLSLGHLNAHETQDTYRQNIKELLDVENDKEDLGQKVVVEDKESDDMYLSVIQNLKQEVKKVKLNEQMFYCFATNVDNLDKYQQDGYQGKVADHFSLIEDDDILCIGSCPSVDREVKNSELSEQELSNQELSEQEILNNQSSQNSQEVRSQQKLSNSQSLSQEDDLDNQSQIQKQMNNESNLSEDREMEVVNNTSQRQSQNQLQNVLSNSQEDDFQFSNEDNQIQVQKSHEQQRINNEGEQRTSLNDKVRIVL